MGCAVAQRTDFASAPRTLWERRFGAPTCPRSRRLGVWHRLCRCSRWSGTPASPLPQISSKSTSYV
ncbi:hypothetical protein FEM01_21550 [Pseudomonas mosselii]|uniref:Uncharacterized protein n=1 Tax=Pseudomonas mosselii TaxID=78327 RepID=A0A5R8YN82_9PSED|nr:hypothetical protein FEM01_21550 [Pseudomonas mosselii]